MTMNDTDYNGTGGFWIPTFPLNLGAAEPAHWATNHNYSVVLADTRGSGSYLLQVSRMSRQSSLTINYRSFS